MPKFIFAYQHPAGHVTRTDAEISAQWVGFFETIGESVVDPGQPVFERTAIGEVGTGTQLGGYSVVEAGSLEDAVALAKHCPTLTYGGGVQVGELAELPPEHPASKTQGPARTGVSSRAAAGAPSVGGGDVGRRATRSRAVMPPSTTNSEPVE